MSAKAIVSVEDYLRRTERPYCEYVDGVLFPEALATTLHARTQFLLHRQGVEAGGLVLRTAPLFGFAME